MQAAVAIPINILTGEELKSSNINEAKPPQEISVEIYIFIDLFAFKVLSLCLWQWSVNVSMEPMVVLTVERAHPLALPPTDHAGCLAERKGRSHNWQVKNTINGSLRAQLSTLVQRVQDSCVLFPPPHFQVGEWAGCAAEVPPLRLE